MPLCGNAPGQKKSALRSEQQGVAEQIREKTGLNLSPYFPASKYAWLQEQVEAVEKAKEAGNLCLGTIDTWLLYKLTRGCRVRDGLFQCIENPVV